MQTQTITFGVDLTVISCGLCGGSYAINERFREKCHAEGTGWRCPYCNRSWGYFGMSLVQKLEKELALERSRLDQQKAETDWQRRRAQKLQRQNSALCGVITRTKKRVGNGVCPCCSRTFQNLARHMECKHPRYKDA